MKVFDSVVVALVAALLGLCIPASAQQPGKIPRIGYPPNVLARADRVIK